MGVREGGRGSYIYEINGVKFKYFASRGYANEVFITVIASVEYCFFKTIYKQFLKLKCGAKDCHRLFLESQTVTQHTEK